MKMKKVMMFIGVVAGVCSLHAANVNWKLQFNSNEVGKDAYVVLASALDGKDMTKLTSDDVTGNALTWANTAGTSTANRIIDKSGKGTGTYSYLKDDDLTAGQAASLYLIVVDGDKYAVANGGNPYAVTAAQVYADGQTGTNVSANNSASALAYTSFQAAPTPPGPGPDPLPEPTSGLLLLVGGAMLALRRKQK